MGARCSCCKRRYDTLRDREGNEVSLEEFDDLSEGEVLIQGPVVQTKSKKDPRNKTKKQKTKEKVMI